MSNVDSFRSNCRLWQTVTVYMETWGLGVCTLTSFSQRSAKFPGIFLLRAQGSRVSWSGTMIATTYDWNWKKNVPFLITCFRKRDRAFSESINSFTRPWPMRPHPINTNKSEALIINNYSSSPNGLWVNSPWGRRPNGLLTQQPWGREE